jgi:hypothetical protein
MKHCESTAKAMGRPVPFSAAENASVFFSAANQRPFSTVEERRFSAA